MVTQHKEKQIGRKLASISKWGRRVVVTLGWLIALFALISSVYMMLEIRSYVITHSFHWQLPLEIKTRPILEIKPMTKPAVSPPIKGGKDSKQATPTPKLKALKAPSNEKDIVFASSSGSVLWKVYGLESSWGKNDYCRLHGLGYAGFGVMYQGEIVCYESFEKAVTRAQYWLEQNGLGVKPLAQVLCKWNLGIDTTTCPYYLSYINL